MAERRLGPVESHRHVVGRVVAHEIDEHGREAVHRVGDLTVRGCHVGREREERRNRVLPALDGLTAYAVIDECEESDLVTDPDEILREGKAVSVRVPPCSE